MTLDIHTIQAQYPHPTVATEAILAQCYCVGGAIVHAARAQNRAIPDVPFPSPSFLANVLRLIVVDMPNNVAFIYACRIIEANDAQDFERAWDITGEALAWRQKESL